MTAWYRSRSPSAAQRSRRVLMLDGVVLARRTGAGAIRRPVTAYPAIPVQRCWAHKIRNVLGKVRVTDQAAVKADLHAVMNAKTLPQARSAARRFADHW